MRIFLALALMLLGNTSATAGLLDRLGLGEAEKPPLLKVDQAFIYNAAVEDGNTIIARVNIVEGYYLYRDKFAFQILDTPEVKVSTAKLPPGKVKEDPFFGTTEVYEGKTELQIPIKLNRQGTTPETVILEASLQGCSEIHGICYPPATQRISLELPSPSIDEAGSIEADSGLTPEQSPAIALSTQDRIVQTLFNDQIWLTLAAFFGFGLLLSFTPCVFPMIPILSGIIVGQGKNITTWRSFMLSLAYVLAMALTYTVAGIVASLLGENLQATFQHPGILIGASLIFVLLALSMFDLYHIQLPSRLQTRLLRLSQKQKGGTLLGAGLMGLFSALIVGPCVAPPLAGALIYIGESGDALLGGSALFALSMGMGTPLLFLGASAGKLLPHVGSWMQPIKYLFGVLLLAVAIWLLSRILPQAIIMLLWGALFIIGAVYLGALEALGPDTTGWSRLWKGMGLISLVYGTLLIIGAASGGGTEWQPLRGLTVARSANTPTSTESLNFQPVKGIQGLQLALQGAGERLVMLDFYADWCVDCKRMEATTFSDPTVKNALRNTLLLQTDVTAYDDQDKALLNQLSLYGPPSILFFGPDGRELRQVRLIGQASPEEFLRHLQQVNTLLAQQTSKGA
ncbi:protein-disulfide reductase DsbD [Nitrosococcus oceani]|uniref:Thiol:disulfide interchange protein DsbD n=2 Tax=Nitrosococcus oceani TaxID=1229 RepID=Q3JC83_NITOC|nr:protein-disulfide reductase DsbD [Nitrosococcus oceani]KFI20063.1 cytochrome C biogenesis protein [Nitrosococcus oceani C-27]ABA57563.1 Cytochrome c biogenesis protein, transmembrane region [Nitrosococcus oceani ATCC 19707]EDZ67126.1 Cytochrome C biogenesis protein transmembrane region [Nitrosococcus oceani AFC27]KFI23234.1 cytochrome C biogenesis protein [Nitrosococcus oceani]GEM20648.1 cytochrome c biogenesis protein [Nitrosococcus oceani]